MTSPAVLRDLMRPVGPVACGLSAAVEFDAAVSFARKHGEAVQASRSDAGFIQVQTTQAKRSGDEFGAGGPFENGSPIGARSLDEWRGQDSFALDQSTRRLARLRMNVGFAARALMVSAKRGHREQAWMVTLTYKHPHSHALGWKPEHIRNALTSFRNWCKLKGFPCKYVWVAELQQRGVIHYHVICWLPKHQQMPFWDKKRKGAKSSWWPHGMGNTEKARNAIGYILKYVSKGGLTNGFNYPKGARIYGVGGVPDDLRRSRAWLNAPAMVRNSCSIDDLWKRVPGGGWMDRETGEVHASEYEVRRLGHMWYAKRVRTHQIRIQASGPFSWIH